MSVTNLEYKEDSRWVSLPYFAKYFIKLGNFIASSENNFSVAICLPINNYAAIFIASGIAAYKLKTNQPSTFSIEDFRKFPSGTPLLLQENELAVQAKFLEVSNIANIEYIKYQISKKHGLNGPGYAYLPATEIYRLSLASSESSTIGKSVDIHYDFIKSILETENIKSIGASTQDKIYIFGSAKKLIDEACIPRIRATWNNERFTGCLNDLLFIKGLKQSQDIDLVVINPKKNHEDSITKKEFLIFDGGKAFQEREYLSEKAKTVILIDKSEPHAFESIQLLNQKIARLGTTKLSFEFPPPPGVEICLIEGQE